MRSFTVLSLVFISLVVSAVGQSNSDASETRIADPGRPAVVGPDGVDSQEKDEAALEQSSGGPKPAAIKDRTRKSDRFPTTDLKSKGDDDGLTATGYVRPSSSKRFKNYLNNVVGPFAFARYAATSGILTWRKSPTEWGDKWEGFGRRFANSLGKSAVRNTTIYALDEALRLDSNFYKSRDRSVAARLRNSVFSAVTARNKSGKRVVGVPRIIGGFTSEVISSTAWYPPRYDVVHGLKGGGISLGVNAAFNLFREFVWK